MARLHLEAQRATANGISLLLLLVRRRRTVLLLPAGAGTVARSAARRHLALMPACRQAACWQ